MMPRRAATLDLEAQVLFVWNAEREPIVDAVVVTDWANDRLFVPGGALVTLMCEAPAAGEFGSLISSVLAGWADTGAVVRARVGRGRDRVEISDGDTDVTLDLRSAVLEAHPTA